MDLFLIFKQKMNLLASLFVGGAMLIVVGVIILTATQNEEFILKLKVSSNSWRYNVWVNSKVPRLTHVYLFNWTNPNDYLKNVSIKPHFVEVGPFVFEEKMDVSGTEWNHNDGIFTLSFRQKKSWYFVPESSNHSLSVNITNLNIPALAIAHMFENEPDDKIRRIAELMLDKKESFAITKSAKELLFDGYSDITVKNINIVKKKLPFSEFGWFYGRNGSEYYDGLFEMRVSDRFETLLKWNNSRNTNSYSGDCGAVDGGISEIISAFKTSKLIKLFESDICRSLPYTYNSSAAYDDLKGLKYTGTIFDNGVLDGSSRCFCNGKCVPNGALNVTSCKKGLPFFISYPHFFYADSSYLNSVDGISPDKEKHESYVVLEENSGIPIEAHKTYQLNTLLRPYSFHPFDEAANVFIPLMWYKEHWKADVDFSQKLLEVLTPQQAGVPVLLLILGAVSVLIAIGVFFIKTFWFKDSDTKSLLDNLIE